MPHQTEPSVNNAMGLLLQTMLSRSSVRSENTRTIAGHPSLRPDILITGLGRSPMGHDSNVVGAVPSVVVPAPSDRPAVTEVRVIATVQWGVPEEWYMLLPVEVVRESLLRLLAASVMVVMGNMLPRRRIRICAEDQSRPVPFGADARQRTV